MIVFLCLLMPNVLTDDKSTVDINYVIYILDVVADVIAKDVMAIMPCDRCYSHFY